MTKRILALLLAVLLGVSCFALTACGGEEEAPKPETKPETNVGGTTPPAQTPTTGGGETEVPETPPTLQLFSTEATLIIGEDTWDFASNAFVMGHDTLTFASSDEAVATVDGDGLVTPVAEGTATITITAAKGDQSVSAELALTVKKPFEPKDPVDVEIFNIMRGDYKVFETYANYSVNWDGHELNTEEPVGTTAGPIEIWSNTLQLLFKLTDTEVDATVGLGEATYDFYFDFYYKPYDAETEKEGGYKKTTIQAWSSYKFGDGSIIYRCKIGGSDFMDLEEGKYTVQIVVRQGDLIKGWCTATDFNITDSCTAFINYANEHSDTIII